MPDQFISKLQFEAKTLVNVRGTPSWTRLEPQSVTGDPRPGLEARVHDPLWLLCRQWQFGELEGDDAGSPLGVELSARSAPLTHWQAGAWDTPQPKPVLELDERRLLEPVVEGKPARAGLRERAQAGGAFIAGLEDAGFGQLRGALLQHAGVQEMPAADPFDRSWPGLMTALAGRAVDAQRLAQALDAAAGQPDGLPGWLAPAAAQARHKVGQLATSWRQWYRDEIAPPPEPESDAWVGERLEYRFSAAGRTAAGEVVLRAPEFVGGEVDWYSLDLDIAPAAPFGTPGQTPTSVTKTVSATPLRFAGMPSDRLWEFEDAAVNLGALQAEPHDLARLLLVEYAMSYGNDWLVVPVDVPFGSLTTIDWITYTNTFGERFVVRDPRTLRANDPWRMFTVTTSDGAHELDALVMPPAVVSYEEGPAVEDVLLLRDENANLAWAVERTVQAPSGDTRSRIDEHTQPPPPAPEQVATAELDYLLQTGVPAHWIPYLPRTSGYASIELAQGRMLSVDGSPPAGPKGLLLAEPGSAVLVDAEVPREGVRVRRVHVLARRVDGGYERWIARRVGVGKAEGASGLAFDVARPRRPGS